MSSANNTSLPPRPSSQFDHLSPVQRPHTTWDPISVHTAKCDVCSKHNTSVLQRCTRCNRQLCKNCITSAINDGIHSANEGELNWIPEKRVTATGKKFAASTMPPKKRFIPTSTKSKAASKVTKTIPKVRAMAEAAKERLEIEVAENKTGMITPMLTPKITPLISNAEQNSGSDTEEDPMLEEKIRTNNLRIIRRKSGTPKMRVHWDDEVENEDEAMTTRGNDKGLAGQESVVSNTTAKKTSNIAKEDSGETFREVIADLSNQSQQVKLILFNDDKKTAWESNPIIQELRRQGREDEAMEMLEAASDLIRMRRGLQ